MESFTSILAFKGQYENIFMISAFVPSLSFGGNFYGGPRYGFVSKSCKLILGLEGPCWTIPIPSALCAVPVFSSRFKKESPGISVGRALDF